MSLNGAGGIMHDQIRHSVGWEVQVTYTISCLRLRLAVALELLDPPSIY